MNGTTALLTIAALAVAWIIAVTATVRAERRRATRLQGLLTGRLKEQAAAIESLNISIDLMGYTIHEGLEALGENTPPTGPRRG